MQNAARRKLHTLKVGAHTVVCACLDAFTCQKSKLKVVRPNCRRGVISKRKLSVWSLLVIVLHNPLRIRESFVTNKNANRHSCVDCLTRCLLNEKSNSLT